MRVSAPSKTVEMTLNLQRKIESLIGTVRAIMQPFYEVIVVRTKQDQKQRLQYPRANLNLRWFAAEVTRRIKLQIQKGGSRDSFTEDDGHASL